MKKYKLLGAVWIFLYAILVLSPIIILILGADPSGRPPLLNLSVSLGFIGLSVMSLQFINSARFKCIEKPFGADIIYHFHRQIGIAAFFMVFTHPILLFILDQRYLRLLNIFTLPLQANHMGVGAVLLLIGVVWMAEYRQKLHIPYWFWKLWHGIMATAMIAMAVTHIFLTGSYVDLPWKRVFWIGYSILLVLTLIYTRVIYPLRLMAKPYRVKDVKEERGSVWTISLEAIGHQGFIFQPGQFAWLTAWKTPFSDSEHPFSLVSSAENKDAIQMSIKNLGPFTAKIQTLKPGEKVYIDGPYGSFSMDRHPDAEKFIFIPGGIGVTPVMSMLRSMAERDDQRPIKLFYCNFEWETVTFREEILTLQKKLKMQIVFVIERPPQNWTGEAGFLNTAILKKYLSEDWLCGQAEVFLCGPSPMMNAVEKALIETGVPEKNIHSERFALV